MAESNSIQTLTLVTTEVDESQTKLTLASQCIKAQEDLAQKLRKGSQRRREICNSMKCDNLKLENEIKNAQQEINSLMIAHQTIKSANVELKKELLLSKKNHMDIVKQVANGIKKYEDMWLECKNRFESIPFVQKWLQGIKKTDTLKEDINFLDNEAKILQQEIKTKKNSLKEKDQKKLIELAEFFVKELPVNIKMLQDKETEVKKVANEIKKITDEVIAKSSRVSTVSSAMSTLNLQAPEEIKPQNDSYFMMPQLRLSNVELDVISVKLDQIKNIDYQQTTPIKRTDSDTGLEKNKNKRSKSEKNFNDDYISLYFNNQATIHEIDNEHENKTDNFSKRKLINILADVKLDDKETYNILSKVNPNKLHDVNSIAADVNNSHNETKNKVTAPMESDEIEEIDLTNQSQNILVPPSQFTDTTQERVFRNSQNDVEVIVHMTMEDMPPENINSGQIMSSQGSAKRVSFDLPMTVQEVTDDLLSEDVNKTNENAGNEANETINSVNDDNYMKIKDMILKKHNLDLSPQFVYAKNTTVKRNDEKIVTSKFFDQNTNETEVEKLNIDNKQNIDGGVHLVQNSQVNHGKQQITKAEKDVFPINLSNIEENANVYNTKAKGSQKPVAGFLFDHGPQGIPDTLDISLSTTGCDEGEDFPHCLDSSLLLSPKADLPHASGEMAEVGSQEVPNFLSGIKKAGLSFFGQKPTMENNSESNGQNPDNNFNFNFGRDEMKNKSRLFSFFR